MFHSHVERRVKKTGAAEGKVVSISYTDSWANLVVRYVEQRCNQTEPGAFLEQCIGEENAVECLSGSTH